MSKYNTDLPRLLADPVYFVEQLWLTLELDKVAPLGDAEREIIRFIAAVDGEPPTRVAMGPRGLGKTYLAAAVACWLLLGDANLKVLIVSKSVGHAKATLHMIRSWLETVWFLEDRMPIGGLRDSAIGFDVSGSEAAASADRTFSIAACGIEGQLPGLRAHMVLADDVETDENVQTVDSRGKLAKKLSEFKSIAQYGRGDICFLGTPWHKESIYTSVLPGRSYMVRAWPILYPSPEERVIGLAPRLVADLESGKASPGDRVFPHKHTWEKIASFKAEGRQYFLMQYMLVADLPDAATYPFKLSDLIVWACPDDEAPINIHWGQVNANGAKTIIESSDIPNYGFMGDHLLRPIKIAETWQPYQDVRMRVDPASTGKDATGYAIGARLGSKAFIKEVGGLRGVPDENGRVSNMDASVLDRLARAARRHRVKKCIVEKNFGGESFATLLQTEMRKHFIKPNTNHALPGGWACTVETEHSSGQKELRIIGHAEPMLASHRVVIDDSVARNKDFQTQYCNLTRDRDSLDHDDIIEPFAAVIHDLNAGDVSENALTEADAREREIRKMIEWGQKHGVMTKPKEPNWIVR